MLKRIYITVLVSMSICGMGSNAHAQLCPGQGSSLYPTNLACEIAVASRSGFSNLKAVPTTIASQLGQLPLASAVSGSGLTLNRSLGVFTATEDSLGTILTQRGETMGRKKLLMSFTYQHFSFGSIDGISLKEFPTVACWSGSNPVPCTSGTPAYEQSVNNIDLSVNQYTVLAGYGLTDKIDVAFTLPFSQVNLSTKSIVNIYPASGVPSSANYDIPGSASGIGDVAVNVKANVYKGEQARVAIGGEVRFPSGDAANYLGSGAYGFKPYIVISGHGRLTPNISLAYQWNGNSILNGGKSLPGSIMYSAGADYRVNRKFTLVGEFLGQAVINGTELSLTTVAIPGQPIAYNNSVQTSDHKKYFMDNVGGGFKANPYKNLMVNASLLFKIDKFGLRSTVIPLAGASYRF